MAEYKISPLLHSGEIFMLYTYIFHLNDDNSQLRYPLKIVMHVRDYTF